MRYLSLFTGIGGFELGIQSAYESLHGREDETLFDNGGDESGAHSEDVQGRPLCVGYSEIDKYAVATYQKHFPSHTNYGDITKLNEHDLPDFDLICGGFPCQSFSIAGKRGGFADTRGTLFFDIARIIKAKQPRLLLLENVKGLLSHDEGRTFATIIGTLDELGYDLQWQVLNSKDFGVPQNRERIFIVGNLRGTPRPEVFPLAGADSEDSQAIGDDEPGTQGIATRHLGRNGGLKSAIASTLQVAEVPHIVQINQPKHSNDRVYDPEGISPTLNTMQGGNRQPFIQVPEATKQGYAEATVGDSINLSVPNSKTRRGRVGKGIAQTLDTGMQQHTLTGEALIRRLTPTECERLQGFPDGWTEGVSDSQRYKMLGNAVTVNVIRAIAGRLNPQP